MPWSCGVSLTRVQSGLRFPGISSGTQAAATRTVVEEGAEERVDVGDLSWADKVGYDVRLGMCDV